MHLDISHVLAAEQAARLRDSAQAPSRLAALLGRFLPKRRAQPPRVAEVARASQAPEAERLAA